MKLIIQLLIISTCFFACRIEKHQKHLGNDVSPHELLKDTTILYPKDTSLYYPYCILFRNNPYGFDTSSIVQLRLNSKVTPSSIVYQGHYQTKIPIMIPKILENHGIEPHLIIQREKKQFNQAKKGTSFKLIFYHDPTGDILNVMFLDDPLFVMFTGGFT